MSYSYLFSPITIKGLYFKNRIVMPPMATNYGIVTDQSIAYYTKRSLGGVGSIIVEGVPTHLFHDKKFQDRLKLLSDGIHKGRANAFVQLVIRSNPQPRRDVTDIPIDEIKAMIDDFVFAGKVVLEAGFDHRALAIANRKLSQVGCRVGRRANLEGGIAVVGSYCRDVQQSAIKRHGKQRGQVGDQRSVHMKGVVHQGFHAFAPFPSSRDRHWVSRRLA